MEFLKKYIFGINILTALSFSFIFLSGQKYDWPLLGYLLMSVIYYKSNAFVFEGLPTIVSALYNYALCLSVVAIGFSGFRNRIRWQIAFVSSLYLLSFFFTPIFRSDPISGVTAITMAIFCFFNLLSAITTFRLASDEYTEKDLVHL